ncbi:hypothetical protein C8A00DRAFT_29050 [Chaetomidium leptoderma]|uniref:Aminoglycoside phosphotransferase domain-containing protein n=1 Tax=Chaetomidium leptoderma TaxID=669021 RepID=A0AAN6VUM2_9PEZI|nr:hypothetical protein C8A00DRAFT_29050 [Chaetomidium leptoderma]
MEEILQILTAKASSLRNGIPSKPVDSQAINGTFNSVYFVRFADGVEWAARVSINAISRGRPLPADDIDRFASEISSLRWLKHNTSVKIPELYAWNIPEVRTPERSDSCWPPAQGLAADHVPWMLMEKLPGIPLSYKKFWLK